MASKVESRDPPRYGGCTLAMASVVMPEMVGVKGILGMDRVVKVGLGHMILIFHHQIGISGKYIIMGIQENPIIAVNSCL